MSRFFGKVRQNGYVVRDIDAALRHWTGVLGVGPFFYIDRVPVKGFRYRGQPSDVQMSIALANSGDLQIELIQQRNAAPSLYRDFLEAGHEGLQHLAYWTTDYQADYDRLLAQGYGVGHEGEIGEQGRFAYFDTDAPPDAHPGTVIELSDVSGPKGRFFEHIRRAAETWDGSDPVRPVKN